MLLKRYIISALFLLSFISGFAQEIEIPNSIEYSGIPWAKWKINNEQDVRSFYEVNEYKIAWTGEGNKKSLDHLLKLLDASPYFGLDRNDYQVEFISQYKSGNIFIGGFNNTLEAEIRFTDAALHFFTDIAFGNRIPSLSYAGLSYRPDCISVPW